MDKIQNEHIIGTTRVAQASVNISEKNYSSHVAWPCDEVGTVRIMLDVDIPVKTGLLYGAEIWATERGHESRL